MNCGYGQGYSVLDVIEAVKRASGVDFDIQLVARRAGDPAALIARADKVREVLGWRPRLDDLDTIVTQALAWERSLSDREAAAVA